MCLFYCLLPSFTSCQVSVLIVEQLPTAEVIGDCWGASSLMQTSHVSRVRLLETGCSVALRFIDPMAGKLRGEGCQGRIRWRALVESERDMVTARIGYGTIASCYTPALFEGPSEDGVGPDKGIQRLGET